MILQHRTVKRGGGGEDMISWKFKPIIIILLIHMIKCDFIYLHIFLDLEGRYNPAGRAGLHPVRSRIWRFRQILTGSFISLNTILLRFFKYRYFFLTLIFELIFSILLRFFKQRFYSIVWIFFFNFNFWTYLFDFIRIF